MKSKLLVLACCVLFAVSCNKTQLAIDPEDQLVADIAVIDEYLAANGITAVQHPSGLRYVITSEGFGEKPTSNDCIRIDYSGRLLFETVPFETATGFATTMSSSTDRPLVRGWRIGLKEVKKGGSITLYIPSGLAYGTSSTKNADGEVVVPANSNLVFDVTVHNITKYNAAGQYCYPWP
jgi:FKBP-type peptidyl-prolyl cis-trans isomerase FkpA